MTILTLSETGALQLGADTLAHLGVAPGGTVEVRLVEGQGVVVKPALQPSHETASNRPVGQRPLDKAFGMLSRHHKGPPRTLDEINETIEAAWAGER